MIRSSDNDHATNSGKPQSSHDIARDLSKKASFKESRKKKDAQTLPPCGPSDSGVYGAGSNTMQLKDSQANANGPSG